MNRDQRMNCANETVAICEAGSYTAPSGNRVVIASMLKSAVDGTVIYSPENPPRANSRALVKTNISVHNQTTFEAILTLEQNSDGHVACLNFASAKNPGGGFLTGAQAQEEALARASGLYPCLLKAPEYYERNRANRSTLYLDLVIYSPRVPFFRDDNGVLLEKSVLASIITAPAPNAGAVLRNEPQNAPAIEPTLKRRAELVLQAAQANNVECLVLGAWGCGVFRNEPRMVAGAFAELITGNGKFSGVFNKIVFAVYDRTEALATYRAFAKTFTGGAT